MTDHVGRLRLYADMREEMGRLVGNDLAGHLRAAADHVVALEAERDALKADLDWIHGYLGSEADWDELDDDGYESRWYRRVGQRAAGSTDSSTP